MARCNPGTAWTPVPRGTPCTGPWSARRGKHKHSCSWQNKSCVTCTRCTACQPLGTGRLHTAQGSWFHSGRFVKALRYLPPRSRSCSHLRHGPLLVAAAARVSQTSCGSQHHLGCSLSSFPQKGTIYLTHTCCKCGTVCRLVGSYNVPPANLFFSRASALTLTLLLCGCSSTPAPPSSAFSCAHSWTYASRSSPSAACSC